MMQGKLMLKLHQSLALKPDTFNSFRNMCKWGKTSHKSREILIVHLAQQKTVVYIS